MAEFQDICAKINSTVNHIIFAFPFSITCK